MVAAEFPVSIDHSVHKGILHLTHKNFWVPESPFWEAQKEKIGTWGNYMKITAKWVTK